MSAYLTINDINRRTWRCVALRSSTTRSVVWCPVLSRTSRPTSELSLVSRGRLLLSCCYVCFIVNRGRSNLSRGDIVHLAQHTSCRIIYHISDIIFARWQHASRIWSWGAFGTPILWEGKVVGVSMVPFERAMVVFYRLSIVTIALFVTIRPKFAVNRGLVTLGQRFWRKGTIDVS